MKPVESILDPQELALLSDPEVLPRKHSVQRKLEKILFQTGRGLQSMHFPLPWTSMAPKLSRGENYQQQAYRVMDFPRIQEEGAFLFYRTLILWGHPIGIHLIASGHFMERLIPVFLSCYKSLSPHWQFAAQDTPWIWEAEAIGLIPCSQIAEVQLRKEINKRKFLKLSSFIPLAQYPDLSRVSQARFTELHQQLFHPLMPNL